MVVCLKREIWGKKTVKKICKDRIIGGGVKKLLLEGKFTQAPHIPGQKNILLWPGP